MTRVTVVIREVGQSKPDYSLDFELQAIPHRGEYISIQRPDNPEPYGEDMIVEEVWWRLKHPETSTVGSAPPKVGNFNEIFVECSPAIGPWSSDHWRDSLNTAKDEGKVKELNVARLSVRQDALKK